MQTYRQLADAISRQLAEKGLVSPEAQARIITEAAGNDRFFNLAMREVAEKAAETAHRIVARRLTGEPLQYILGSAPFRDLELLVTPDVLIPRPETELLAGFCIDELPPDGSLLDLGTGSGAIALAVAFERRDVNVTAVDVSPAALAVARRNGEKYQLLERVEFRCSDLFAGVKGRQFDVIAANLPYVTLAEYPTLDAEVRDFEPQLALTAEDDGLRLIRRAIGELNAALAPGGKAFFELSPPQAKIVADELAQAGFESRIRFDLTQRARFVAATKR